MAQVTPKLAKELGQVQPLRISEGITHRQLARVLRDASETASGLIEKNLAKGTISGRTRAEQLKAAMAGSGKVADSMWHKTGNITKAGMYEAAELAADQALDQDFYLGLPAKGVLQMATAIHYDAAQAVNDIISRRTEGFALSERIYANGKVTTKQVGKIVERGLALQLSAREIASQVRNHYRPDVPGGASYAAMRLARTEINNAHHTTTIRLSDEKPWIVGYKWNLSGSHPKPDACNDYAEKDHDNLGPGIYKKGNAPSKPHPQCLCYLTHMQEDEDEFMDKLVNGKYDNYMKQKGVGCP